jgi:hypothetical protein
MTHLFFAHSDNWMIPVVVCASKSGTGAFSSNLARVISFEIVLMRNLLVHFNPPYQETHK